MPRAFRMLALAVAVIACSSTSSMKVQTEYDKAANFKGYRTYEWIPQQPGPEQAPAARDPRIREAVIRGVDDGLAAKGLIKAEPNASADLLVAVHGWAGNPIDVRNYG